jgi:hypothetical protein
MGHPQNLFAEARIWAQIDHQLVLLKMSQAASGFGDKYAQRKANYPRGNRWGFLVATVALHIERAKGWTEKVFEIYGEVWEKQGKARTSDFVRAVFNEALLLAIEASVGTAESKITRLAMRTGLSFSLSPLLQKLALDADRLKSEWRRRIEIEARELQLEQARRPVQAVPSNQQHPAEGIAERAKEAKDNLKPRSHAEGGMDEKYKADVEGLLRDRKQLAAMQQLYQETGQPASLEREIVRLQKKITREGLRLNKIRANVWERQFHVQHGQNRDPGESTDFLVGCLAGRGLVRLGVQLEPARAITDLAPGHH